ncbi:hypothetical protein [Sphaerospermopsis sp. FACHB-1194]|uniref:hypothetical protein n=1 Tax=Sphaerospermopsis sp. FACHB-1194 TaxID=2692862 RepID=UPI00168042A2|nr:hypothetical protein [Sphaerospermopsis sp. FACHB-1194]
MTVAPTPSVLISGVIAQPLVFAGVLLVSSVGLASCDGCVDGSGRLAQREFKG